MRLRQLLPLCALLLISQCYAGIITGRVFIDLNGDGQWQPTDRPCPQVLVSDEVRLVTTDAEGRYRLSGPQGPRVVFIENPPQTWPTRGFWRYLPAGAGTVDFPLQEQEQKLPFTFVQGTDLHTHAGVNHLMARYVEAVNTLPVPLAFVVHTGDLVSDVGATVVANARLRFTTYQQQVANLKAPLFNVAGNHEHVSWYLPKFDPAEPGVGKGLYREMFGPLHYAFNYAGVRFIALDGTDYLKGKLEYSMPPGCVQWLRAYLATVPPTDRLVLLCHEPLFTLPQKAELEQILAGRAVIVSLSGHWHIISRQTFAGAPEIVAGATCYAWHGASPGFDAMGYHVVRINEQGFDSAFGDWADKYSVTVDQPKVGEIVQGQVQVQARILDLAREVSRVQISLGEVGQEAGALVDEGLTRQVTATLDVGRLPEGYHDLVLTMHGTGEPWQKRQPRLVQTGQREAFTATAPARLSMILRRVNAANVVKVNGETVGAMPPNLPTGQTWTVEVPAPLLRRLNQIEFLSLPLGEGQLYDDFVAERVTLEYNGQKFMDPRTKYGATAVLNGKQPTTTPLWLDLVYQAPEGPR